MSLFQCDKCGCIENTSCTSGYHMMGTDRLDEKFPEVAASYREVLGLHPSDHFGCYCSACSPIWFNEQRTYGTGRPPEGYEATYGGEHYGVWHGKFERSYLPKGLFHTDENGNVSHVWTLEGPEKYEAAEEFESRRRTIHPPWRLPRPHTGEAAHWLQCVKVVKGMPPEVTAKLVDLYGGELDAVYLLWTNQIEISIAQQPSNEKIREDLQTFVETGSFDGRAKKVDSGKLKMMAMVAGMAAMGGAVATGSDRPPPSTSRPDTPEEAAARAARGEAKRAAAEEKRARKGARLVAAEEARRAKER